MLLLLVNAEQYMFTLLHRKIISKAKDLLGFATSFPGYNSYLGACETHFQVHLLKFLNETEEMVFSVLRCFFVCF